MGAAGVETLETRQLLAIDLELNFRGQTGGFPFPQNPVSPPDPVLDVGTRHVMHAVNHATFGSAVTIYDKRNGELIRGPFPMKELASPVGACGVGIGDPVILFDHLAKRWLAGEFATGPDGDNHMCLYISNTDNPMEGWTSYDVPTQLFPDYPKISVWHDGYYMTTNEPPGEPPNVPAVYALDRENMLKALPMRPPQRFVGPPLTGFEFQSFAAADLDGPRAPLGTPNLMMRHVDDELHGPSSTAQDRLEIWEFLADFDDPTRSRFELVQTVATRDFDSDFGPFPQDAIEQPGIVDLPEQLLDAISEVVMNQLKYRNFGTHETLLGSHTVDVNGNDLAGVHWFELRRAPGGQWTLFQEGVIAPNDPHDRWLPSPAMNGDQTIAIGYAISSSTLSPSMRLNGRVRTDPLGVMTQGERVMVNGSGFEESGRFGDYFSMVVDPVDDFTFWFAGEAANNGGWSTQLAKFHIDSPETPPPPPPSPAKVIQGLVFNDVDADGVRDAGERGLPGFVVYADIDRDGRLDLNEPNAKTRQDGTYQLSALPVGTYFVRQVRPTGWRQTFPAGDAHHTVVITANGVSPSSADFGNTGGTLRDFGNDRGNKQTLLTANGARHRILPGFQLGSSVDGEADAQANDTNDGVSFPSPLVAGKRARAVVTIETGGQPRGRLQGFIDFNQDGDWNDKRERIISNVRLGAGTHTIEFKVPKKAITGETHARFRYGWENNLGPAGESAAGEVEDYVVGVFGNVPQAIDDSFTVPQDPEDPVTLNVLANDFASSAGNLRIQSVGDPSRGGTVTLATDRQTILYEPRANFFGTETFSYTVTDDSGKTDTGLVTITVEPTFLTPQAIDDQASVSLNSSSNVIRVLQNDILGVNPPTRISAIADDPDDGTASIDTNGTANPTDDVIRYTPENGFVGVDQFVYRITDALGNTSEATVTVFVGDAFSDDTVRYTLQLTDLNGNPISQVEVGDTFVMTVLVADVRTDVPVADRGVFAAYLDVLYPAGLVSLENELVFNGEYTSVPEGNTSVPGILDETGALREIGAPPGPGDKVLYRAAFRAESTGVATFLADPADDVRDPGPPEVLGDHDTLLYEPTSAVPIDDITYLSTSITIISSGEGEGERSTSSTWAADANGGQRQVSSQVLALISQIIAQSGNPAESDSGAQNQANGTPVPVSMVSVRDLLATMRLRALQQQQSTAHDAALREISTSDESPTTSDLDDILDQIVVSRSKRARPR